MATGYGTCGYGYDAYGIGGVDESISFPIVVQPTSGVAGDRILIAPIGTYITDTSRNDSFSSDSGLWAVSTSNAIFNYGQGLTTEARSNPAGSLFQLFSVDNCISGDLTLEYEILSTYMVDAPAAEITYAGMEMRFGTHSTFTIKRSVDMLSGGQQVRAQSMLGTQFNGGAIRLTSASSGKLRIIRHGNLIAAVVDDDKYPLFISGLDTNLPFSVRLFTSTNGQNAYFKTRYVTYKSNTGILVGDSFMINKTIESPTRIIGDIPVSPYIGMVDITAFNHGGLVGFASHAFEYMLGPHFSLSKNSGQNIIILNDSALRD
jgi:hypothetical protein